MTRGSGVPHAKPRRTRSKLENLGIVLRAFAASRTHWILGVFLALPLSTHAADLRLGGHAKSLNVYVQAPPAGGRPSGEVSSNRLRLDLTGAFPRKLDFEVSAETILRYNDPPGLLPLPADSVNRTRDLEKNWNTEGRFSNRLFVDRLNLQGRLGEVQWTVGRQAVGFGRIALFSPLDVIAPFAPGALDTDVRPGVDALRAVRYFGLGGQIGGIAVLGDGSENNSYLLTFSHHLTGTDLLAMGGSLRERTMAGVALAGSLGGLGLKGEAAFYDGKNVGEPDGDLHGDFAITAVETWYRFANDLVLLTEYLYNGAGVEDPEDYPEVLASAPFREGLSFLFGRHYLLAGPSYELHPLATLQGTLIWNLEDDSFFLRPLLDLSLSDNLAMQLFWNFNKGDKPKEVFGVSVPRSEFGSVADSGGVFLKYFF